ncbi:MAG: oligosaccharide flippase family protein [Acidimicrobiales bacterium]
MATRSVRGAALLGARQLASMVLSAISAIVLARWLEPSDYGMFATLNMIVFGAATILGDLGLTVALVRQPVEPPPGEWAAAKRLLGAVSVISGIAGAVAVSIVARSGRLELALWIAALVVALVARFSRAVPSARLQRRGSFAALAVIESVESFLYFATVVCLARAGFGAGALALAVGVKEVVGAGAQWWAARGGEPTRGVSAHYRRLIRVGAPVQASGLAVALTDVFQPLFIGSVLGLAALGQSTWAYNLVLMPILLVGAMDRVVLPGLARVQEDRTLLALLTARAVRINVLVVFPVVLAVLVAPGEMVSLVFSDKWLPGADLLVLFVPAVATTAVSAPLLHAFNAAGRTRVAMWLSLTWLVSTWTLGAWVTSTWGLVGFGAFYVALQLSYVPLWMLAARDLGVRVWSETYDAVAALLLGASVGSLVGGWLGTALGDEQADRWFALVGAVVAGELVFCSVVWLVENQRTRADLTFLLRSITGGRRWPLRPALDDGQHSRGWRLSYVPALDGLRGLAVLAVMFHHANFPFLQGGFLGVDVFFVLSGFLITALLVGEYDRVGRIDLKRFYARRALRLMPALVVMVALVCAVLWFWPSGTLRSDSLSSAGWSLAYLSNYLAVLVDRGLGVFGHTWSLAIEEQFYLLWPPVLVWFLTRGRARAAMWSLAIVSGAVALVRAITWLATHDVDQVYFAFHTRADALLVGCLTALITTRIRQDALARWAHRWRHVPLLVGAGLTSIAAFASTSSGWVYVAGLPVVILGCALVIAQLASDSGSAVTQLLGHRLLVWVGSLSYGLYLWHVPVFELVKDAAPQLAYRYLVLIQFALSLAAAVLSHRCVERYFMAVKSRLVPSAQQPTQRSG